MAVSSESFCEKPCRIQHLDSKVTCIKDQWVNMVTMIVAKAELDWEQGANTDRMRFFGLLLPDPT